VRTIADFVEISSAYKDTKHRCQIELIFNHLKHPGIWAMSKNKGSEVVLVTGKYFIN
jgi:hypothetical protein